MKGQLLSLSPMGVTVIPDNNALFFLVGFAFFQRVVVWSFRNDDL